MRDQILALLEESPGGLTSRDLAIKLRTPRATIVRRLEEMKADGLIERTGAMEAGAAVIVAAPQRALQLV